MKAGNLIRLIITLSPAVAFFPMIDAATSDAIANAEAQGTEIPAAQLAIMDSLPVIFGVAVLIGAFAYLVSPAGAPIRERFKWAPYGRRLKRAYHAKYGYENPAFDDEVDNRIRVMRVQGKGHTRTIASDWLKRISKMVEVPFKDLTDEGSQEVLEGDADDVV